MQYNVSNYFLQISETKGTIQNTSNIFSIEVSNQPTPNSGVLLFPLNKYTFINERLYVRCVDGSAVINVVPFVLDTAIVSSGGSSSGDVDEYFTDDDLHDVLDF